MTATIPAVRREDLSYDVFETPMGWVGMVASLAGVRKTTLPEPSVEAALAGLGADIEDAAHDPGVLKPYREVIESYLAGERTDLKAIPLDTRRSTDFFTKAWAACRQIPEGETRTYAWLANEAGRPRAMRAAGQAMARNPLPLLVPCHRVVGSDGGLHGFGGSVGLPLKRRLLDLEKQAASAG